MSEMMTFPDTWEEFEKLYGFNDAEEIYTNNSRLIPSFRVKQWLDHLPSVQPKLANNSPKLDKEIGECNDCIKHGGDWECDRVHCHKGDAISRQAAIKAVKEYFKFSPLEGRQCAKAIERVPSVQPEIIRCGQCKYAEVADSEDSQDGYTCQFHRGSIWFSGSYCSWAELRGDSDD